MTTPDVSNAADGRSDSNAGLAVKWFNNLAGYHKRIANDTRVPLLTRCTAARLAADALETSVILTDNVQIEALPTAAPERKL